VLELWQLLLASGCEVVFEELARPAAFDGVLGVPEAGSGVVELV
jgi:hypothetical protein